MNKTEAVAYWLWLHSVTNVCASIAVQAAVQFASRLTWEADIALKRVDAAPKEQVCSALVTESAPYDVHQLRSTDCA